MKQNDECDIIKDLSPIYIENMETSSTKTFIENHLSNCADCRKYYTNMKSDVLTELDKEKENDSIEFDYLKKVKNHIRILKIILCIFISIFILTIVGILIKSCFINNITSKASNKVSNISKLNNYKLTQTSIYKDLLDGTETKENITYFYKDGKYRIDSNDVVTYLEDNSYNCIRLNTKSKTIDYLTLDFPTQKSYFLDMFYSQLITSNFGISFSVRNDNFNNHDCYVIKKKYGNGYIDTWISKDNYFIVKTIENFDNYYYKETVYSFEENITTDNDVQSSVLKTKPYSDYTITNSNETK